MGKILILLITISTSSFAFIVDGLVFDSFMDEEFYGGNGPSYNILPSKTVRAQLSAQEASEITEEFIEVLYFRTYEEKEIFKESVTEKLYSVMTDNLIFKRVDMLDTLYDVSIKLVFSANNTIDTYYELKNCQINKQVPLDPLSSVVANTLIQALPSFKNATTEAVLRFLIYTYYKEEVINLSNKIYQQRLNECREFTGIHYADRDSEDETADKTQIAIGEEEEVSIGPGAAANT